MRILCLCLGVLIAGNLQASDPDNGPEWRQKLIASCTWGMTGKWKVLAPSPAEISDVLGLADDNLRLDFFVKTYGGTVKQVYESHLLAAQFHASYQQFKGYLKHLDPNATCISLPLNDSSGLDFYPPEINNFTRLEALEFFDAYLHYNQVRGAASSEENQPFFRLFQTMPVLSKVTTLRFLDVTVFFYPGWSAGLVNIKSLDILFPCELSQEFYGLPNLEHLTLRGVTTIPAGCAAWKNLRYLDLSHGKLTNLPDEFSSLVSLTDLNLSGNGLVSQVPVQLTNLVRLNLSQNNCRVFPLICAPGTWPRLASLDLSNNSNLADFPEAMGYLTALTDLNIDHTNVGQLPDAIVRLPGLKRLSAWWIYGKFGQQISGMTQLQSLSFDPLLIGHLDLSGLVGLTELTTDYDNAVAQNQLIKLTALQRLTLERIQYDSDIIMPEGITRLASLVELNLHAVARFPDNINRLTNLQRLYCVMTLPIQAIEPYNWGSIKRLEFRRATTIPSSLGGLTNLEELILNDGNMESLPRELMNLTKLSRLQMRNYKNVDKGQSVMEIIYCLDSLTDLDVSLGSLAEISSNIQYLTRLEKLSISPGFLKKIAPEIGKLPRLRQLMFPAEPNKNPFVAVPETVVDLPSLVLLNQAGLSPISDDLWIKLVLKGVTIV